MFSPPPTLPDPPHLPTKQKQKQKTPQKPKSKQANKITIRPKNAKMKQKSHRKIKSKKPGVHFVLGTLGMGRGWNDTPLEKTDLPVPSRYQLKMESRQGRNLASMSPSQWWAWTAAGLGGAPTDFQFMSASILLGLQDCFLGITSTSCFPGSSPLPALMVFLSPLPYRALDPWPMGHD